MVVDVGDLSGHHGRLRDVIERIEIARDAAQTTVSPDAFGVLGNRLAQECAQSQREGADMLEIALTASKVHREKVGSWVNDLDARELDILAMFKLEWGDDDH
jgi:hypothetical protein